MRSGEPWRRAALALATVISTALLVPTSSDAAPPAPTEPDKPDKKRAAERMGEKVSRGVVAEGLETLDQPDNRARLGRVLSSAEMQDAARELSAAFVLGAIDGLAEGVVEQRTSATPVEFGPSMRKSIDRHLSPAMGRMVGRMVDAALATSLTDERIDRLEVLTERITHAAVRGLARGIEAELGPALATMIDEDLGPALARSIERDNLPALGRGLSTPEMQEVVVNLTRPFATEFVGGAGDAITDQTGSGTDTARSLSVFGNSIALGYAIALFVAFAFGTMLIGLTFILIRNARRLREQSEAASQRDAALSNLIDSLEHEHPDLGTELETKLRRLVLTPSQP